MLGIGLEGAENVCALRFFFFHTFVKYNLRHAACNATVHERALTVPVVGEQSTIVNDAGVNTERTVTAVNFSEARDADAIADVPRLNSQCALLLIFSIHATFVKLTAITGSLCFGLNTKL